MPRIERGDLLNSPATAAGAASQLESVSPVDGRRLGAVPRTRPQDVQGVVDEVGAVQPFWAALPATDRARYMRRAAQVVIDSLDELSALLTREQGKPLNESYVMELVPTVDALHWIAAEGPRLLADESVSLPPFLRDKRAQHAFEPVGVVGVISPWNYPWSIPFGEVAIALMCGNGVVLKPAELTPLIGGRIQAVFERAGFPPGLVRVLHGEGDVGRALVESSVARVFFTGSVETGRTVGVACAERMKRSVLELGGKDPMLVLADADVENAVAGALWGGFANAGQTCSGIERVYVARELEERFVDALVEGARELRVGDPMQWETEIGPMTSHDQLSKVRELVDDAVANGAEVWCGGPLLPGEQPEGLPEGDWFAPTVLSGVTQDMRIMREETFGPVLPVIAVDSEDEAIELANDSEFGLGASVWTADRARGDRIARRLETGMVWINDHMYSHGACSCAWGGVKQSGLGRVHARFGFLECLNVKLVTWESPRRRSFWWHPYDASLGHAMNEAARLLYGRDADRADALKAGLRHFVRLGQKMLAS